MSAALQRRLSARFTGWARPRKPETWPVRLDRHRIYVLPTGFGVFFGVLLAVMGIGALNYNNNPALLLAMLLGGAAIASLVMAHLQLSGLELTGADAEPVAAGMSMRVRLHARASHTGGLHTRAGIRIAPQQADAGSGGWLHWQEGQGEALIHLATHTRGWLRVPRISLATTRPLGLARAWAYAYPETRLLVYPAAETHPPPLPIGGGQKAQARLHPSGEELHHLRLYRRGDARRAIAWKPSARRDQLLVREYEIPMSDEVALQWESLAALGCEDRIRRLAAWVDLAEREGRRYRLELPGMPALGPDRGLQHRHHCLKSLALLPHG